MTAAAAVEIHGLARCPFAWRARIAAALKGVAFDWIAYDVTPVDPRAATHNPHKRSPLLWEEGFTLVESSVIAAYLDESRPGPALQPQDARARAESRVAIAELGGLMLGPPGAEVTAAQRKKVDGALASLEQRLADGRAFLDGDAPGLVDAHAWPALAALAVHGIDVPAAHAKTLAYWQRSQAHTAFTSTKPS